MHVLDELMSRCHVSPEVYISGANYAFYECDDIAATRRFLSNAIKFHPNYQKLYTEEFWIEIQYSDKMGGTSALDKYHNYITLFKDDMKFHFSLVDTILKFTTITELHCLVIKYKTKFKNVHHILVSKNILFCSDMVNKYNHSELMWQNLAKINLKGFAYNYESQSVYYCQDDLQCIRLETLLLIGLLV